MTALKAPCQHGRYDEHSGWLKVAYMDYREVNECPGGTLLPPDSLVIVKEDGEWPDWSRDAVHRSCSVNSAWSVLDALAAAQPGSETELDRNQMEVPYAD